MTEGLLWIHTWPLSRAEISTDKKILLDIKHHRTRIWKSESEVLKENGFLKKEWMFQKKLDSYKY
jgi:hypothetical protein